MQQVLPRRQVESRSEGSEDLDDRRRVDLLDGGPQPVDHAQPQVVLGRSRHHPLDESLDLFVQTETESIKN